MAKKHPAKIQRDRNTRQEYALLLCGEYFRDYLLECGAIGEARMQKLERLRDLCFNVLDNPSLADADAIRQRYGYLMGVKARCPECRVLWVLADEDVRVLRDNLVSGVEEQAFLCAACSVEFVTSSADSRRTS